MAALNEGAKVLGSSLRRTAYAPFPEAITDLLAQRVADRFQGPTDLPAMTRFVGDEAAEKREGMRFSLGNGRLGRIRLQIEMR